MSAVGFDAADQRPLALRLRADLRITTLRLGGMEYRVLHDPIAGKSFQVRPEEFSLLSQLDGRVSLRDLRERFEREFAPQRIGSRRLQAFFAQAYRAGLLLSDYTDQGRELWRRHRAGFGRRFIGALFGILQQRLLRFNPQALLDRVAPSLALLYTNTAFIAWLFGLLGLLWIAASNRREWIDRLPELNQLLGGENLPWLALSLLIAKSWHELGHAVACRRWSVPCREMGVQLLLVVPCLYCDTTEAWRLENKWKRMAISAGGIYFEGFLAFAAALLYATTSPGVLHDLCLNLVVVCTLGTILVNANPLLRYDGYYILSDGLEIANLESRSNAHARNAIWSMFLRSEPPPLGPFEERIDVRLALFGMLMFVYRAMLLVGILWAVRTMLGAVRLDPLADLLQLLVIVGFFTPLLAGVIGKKEPLPSDAPRGGRRFVWPAVILFAALVYLVPLPSTISAKVVIEPGRSETVYAAVPGRIVETLAAGTRVAKGDRIARLENHDLTRERDRLQAAAVDRELLIRQMESRAINRENDATRQLPTERAALAALRRQLADLEELVARLEIKAPCDGIVLPPPRRENDAASESDAESFSRTGTPLEIENRSAYLEVGETICFVASGDTLSASALLDQGEVGRVASGMSAEVCLPAVAKKFQAKVIDVAKIRAEETSPGLDAMLTTDDAEKHATNHFVRLMIPAPSGTILPGVTGRVRISAASETLWTKCRRWWERTFRW